MADGVSAEGVLLAQSWRRFAGSPCGMPGQRRVERRELQIAGALLARDLRPRGFVHQMNAWLAEILELPARRTLRVGGGGSREVSVSYSAEELCHEAARVVLRLRNELASSRQQLACLREGGAQPQSPPPPAGWRSPKARPSAGRKTRRRFGGQEVTCELATQTEPAEAAAQTQTEISSL